VRIRTPACSVQAKTGQAETDLLLYALFFTLEIGPDLVGGSRQLCHRFP
jgi:hypothetical protein